MLCWIVISMMEKLNQGGGEGRSVWSFVILNLIAGAEKMAAEWKHRGRAGPSWALVII